jgi:S-DNA-T family DNA segregation ATPase FtsK/SpoIIIE
MKETAAQNKGWLKILLLTTRRFGQDLIGILLISFSAITLLNFFGLSGGALADAWSHWLLQGFGLGRFLFIAILGYVGFLVMLRHFERFPKLDIKRILSLEIAIFSFLPILSLMGGLSVERAYLGQDGGIVGWGIARVASDLLGVTIATVLFFLIFLVSFLSATGLLGFITSELDGFLTGYLTGSAREKRGNQQTALSHDLEERDHLAGGTIQLNEDGALPKEPVPGPPLDILLDSQKNVSDDSFIHTKAIQIEQTLEEFGVPARVAGYRVGPTIIQYAVEPGFVEKVNEDGDVVRKKVRVSQISALNRDLNLALSVERLRIEAPIPGTSFVGIEIPNRNSTLVRLKPILLSDDFKKNHSSLKIALGLDVSGNPVVADLARMPHLLVAGTTGSGKSVYLTSLISCLVFNNSPDKLKLVILDPKMVELVRFNGLPHLFGKVETEIDRMLGSLAWVVKEMETRILMLESINARDLDAYNLKMLHRGKQQLPRIVVFIDELADLMMTAPDQTEGYLVRLAQIARATGIHLVVATQRPSTDVITGLIKANFPARISFMTASSVDSRVILDANGAETLMGRGDMLFLDPEKAGLTRAQGVLVDDREIEAIIAYWQNKAVNRDGTQVSPWEDLIPSLNAEDADDDLLKKAIELVRGEGRASTSRLQRKLRIGFPRAARLMEELEQKGIVGPGEGGGREREVIPDPDEPEE